MKKTKKNERITNFGEVFTNKNEVTSMLDMVKHETVRIDGRFLEPACGNGNFLLEILKRKILTVEYRYKKSQTEFEKYSILAISSIYGIDLLKDNIAKCKERLFELINTKYTSLYKKTVNIEIQNVFKFILDKNLLVGDCLSMLQMNNKPIVFSEWSFVRGNLFKRREFIFENLIKNKSSKIKPSSQDGNNEILNFDNHSFRPRPVRVYPLKHYLNLNKNV